MKKKPKKKIIKRRRKILIIPSVVIIVIVMIYLETLSRQIENYKKAYEYYKKKDYKNAVVYYQTVLLFYTPLFSKYFKASLDKLFEIGKYYESLKKYKKAADTYAEIVHSIYGIRSFYTPYKKYQEEAKRLQELCLKKLKK
jgi:tetratricopeptide (TPR) repeat protein